MVNVSLVDQLNKAIDLSIANSEAPLPSVDKRIAAQFRIAMSLRDLPRPDFKARLKGDLERRASMTSSAAKSIREGFHTLTPYLIVHEAEELINFVKQAFGAQERFRTTGSAGGIHAELQIGDSTIMLGGGGAWRGTPKPTALHLYVKDADAVYERALEAGAISTHAPVDQPYGDREAGVKDVSGNHWYIATHMPTGHLPEGLRVVTPYLHARGAARMIEFLENAFGAEEQYRAQSPEGIIHHATVKIGDSMLEMGEAHGPWQPMPSTYFLYVENVDDWYRRALAAGAKSESEPADQPYGDRVAGVVDPFDNVWYLATQITS
jgi:uncharacterized glyoxalase superfamily protein PhnB